MPSNYTGADTFHSTIAVPSDGDLESAASVSSPLEALADNAQYLANRAAPLILTQSGGAQVTFATTLFTGWGDQATFATTPQISPSSTPGPIEQFAVSGLAVGDVVEVDLTVSMSLILAAGIGYLRLDGLENGGTGPTASFPVAQQITAIFTGTSQLVLPVTLHGRWTVATGPALYVYLNGAVNIATASHPEYWEPSLLTGSSVGNCLWRVYRAVS
jgi:hypothetical protein